MVIINTMPELEKETDDFGIKKFVKPVLGLIDHDVSFRVYNWKGRSTNWIGYRYMGQIIFSPT